MQFPDLELMPVKSKLHDAIAIITLIKRCNSFHQKAILLLISLSK